MPGEAEAEIGTQRRKFGEERDRDRQRVAEIETCRVQERHTDRKVESETVTEKYGHRDTECGRDRHDRPRPAQGTRRQRRVPEARPLGRRRGVVVRGGA